jgi:hypothetical protein
MERGFCGVVYASTTIGRLSFQVLEDAICPGDLQKMVLSLPY